MKPILSSLLFLMSLSLFGQQDTAFGKYVFKGVNIGYDEENQTLITPENGLTREGCREKVKPTRYTCTEEQGLVTIYLEEESSGNFETTVFHPLEQGYERSVSISTVVKDGKVIQQSTCFYKGLRDPRGGIEKGHYNVQKLECYVASANMCSLFTGSVKEGLVSEEKFKQFVDILKSPEYKKLLLKAQELNYRNIFLHSNEGDNFDHYSKLQKGFYDNNKQGRKKDLGLVHYEISDAVKNSKNLAELVNKNEALVLRAFIKPCANLNKSNIIAESSNSKTE